MTVESAISSAQIAETYRVFSELFRSPGENLADIIGGGSETAVEDALSCLADALPEPEKLLPLKVDYARLFIGPYQHPAPPYGSIYLEDSKTLMGDSTIDALQMYSREGLEISDKEAPDHICIELEFMYYLVFKQIEAEKNNDDEKYESLLEKQKSFWRTHIGAWAFEFAQRVETRAETPFYKILGATFEDFLRAEQERLGAI